jgi:glycosyltransferase involved in cell wall biosynthesis
MNPIVTVYITCYNYGAYVDKAIQSVLSQTLQDFELIIIDDGSTDNTEQILQPYMDRIIYKYQQNGGPPVARNTGLDLATGEYIAFLDADDIWTNNKTAIQKAIFDENSGAEIVLGLYKKQRFETRKDLKGEDTEPEFQLLLGCTMAKRDVFSKIGRLDPELFLGDDTDWFMRAREAGIKIRVHRDLVMYQREHENNSTANKARFNFYVFKVLKKAKDRKKSIENGEVPNMQKPNGKEQLIKLWNTAT